MEPMVITAENFQKEVLESPLPVLLDFWASWCGPCKMMAPVVDELAGEYEGRVKVGKVDVDAEPALAMQYGVSSIPTLILFKNGEAVKQSDGFVPKAQIAAFVEG